MYVEMKNIYKKYGDFLASDNVLPAINQNI